MDTDKYCYTDARIGAQGKKKDNKIYGKAIYFF